MFVTSTFKSDASKNMCAIKKVLLCSRSILVKGSLATLSICLIGCINQTKKYLSWET